jgi:hypothetical protein
MKRSMQLGFAGAVVAGLGVAAHAAPIVNGSYEADYGAALAVQANPTGFGDSNTGQVGTANGSELDAAYGVVQGGNLHIFLAGNLESNFNKLEIFIDAKAGGSQKLIALGNNQGNFNNMGGDGTTTGLTFDNGFAPDHWISPTMGGANPDIFVDYGDLQAHTGNYAGQTLAGSNGVLTGGNGGPSFLLTVNNSNTTGVTSSTAPNDAATVGTGIELSISLAALGWDGSPIHVAAFINGGNHDYASNQVLGSLPAGTGNLGGDGAGNFTGNLFGVDFRQFAGNQFFTVPVPEPMSVGLIGMGALALVARRRRAH